MKTYKLLLTLCILILTYSCNKNCSSDVLIIKDCTGTYVRVDGQDMRVCNTDETENIQNKTIVKATFSKIKSCSGPETEKIVCMMAHEYHGWVKIKVDR